MNHDEYNESNWETIDSLLHTIALIREAAGVNEKPMLSELPDVIRKLREERDEARREVCGFHHLTGFLAGDYAISRGWDCFNDHPRGLGFPPSVKDFKEFLDAQSKLDSETIDRLRQENRELRELRVQGIVSEPQKAVPPKYEFGEDEMV